MSALILAIDLGTANTLIYQKSKGIILNEPSVLATDDKGKVLAVGIEAKEMLGRTHSKLRALRPLQSGVISDFDATVCMLRFFIGKVKLKGIGLKPKAVICVPYRITAIERKAVEEAALSSGIRAVHIIEAPMASAMGAGVNTQAPSGALVLDIGGGTSEASVISLGGIVYSKSIPIAGDSHNEAIKNFIRKKYAISIGAMNAEGIKLKIGTVHKSSNEYRELVCGRNILTGMPCSTYVTGDDIKRALMPYAYSVIDAIRLVLENISPELSSDILNTGIIMTGGASLLNGLDRVICDKINIPVKLADYPLESAVLGAGKLIEQKRKIF